MFLVDKDFTSKCKIAYFCCLTNEGLVTVMMPWPQRILVSDWLAGVCLNGIPGQTWQLQFS